MYVDIVSGEDIILYCNGWRKKLKQQQQEEKRRNVAQLRCSTGLSKHELTNLNISSLFFANIYTSQIHII